MSSLLCLEGVSEGMFLLLGVSSIVLLAN
jgi:hypothetical protein